MAIAAIKNEKVAGKAARELSDADEIAVLQREVAKRKDSAQAYTDGNRPELAARELAEVEVLARYLPAPLTDEELDALVAEEVADLVDAEISQARKIPGTSSLQSAVLAGCNLADRYLKAVEAADNLRGQMKNYLEEASQLRRELADAQKLLDELTEPDRKRHGGKK